jgi:hypothetical protein
LFRTGGVYCQLNLARDAFEVSNPHFLNTIKKENDMSILTKPSGAFPAALIYITVGTLVVVWTVISLILYPPASDLGHFLIIGTLVSGVAILVIGLLLGPIGRFARHAEMPPTEVTTAVESTDQTAAANPPVVIPTAIPQGGIAPRGNGHPVPSEAPIPR